MIGGLAIIGIVVAMLVFLRKRRTGKDKETDTAEVAEHSSYDPTLTPYRQYRSSNYTPVPSLSNAATAGFAGIGAGDIGAYEGVVVSSSPDTSTKARREATPTRPATRQPAPSESVATSSIVGSQTRSESSRDLLSQRQSISTTDVVGLQTEVENLRRVMRDIRAERLEAPPEYVE